MPVDERVGKNVAPATSKLFNSFEYLHAFNRFPAIFEQRPPCECNLRLVFRKHTVNDDIVVFCHCPFDTLDPLAVLQIDHAILKDASPNVDLHRRPIDHVGCLSHNEAFNPNGNSVSSVRDSMDRPRLACRTAKWPGNTCIYNNYCSTKGGRSKW